VSDYRLLKLDGIAPILTARHGLPGDLGRDGGWRLSHVFFQHPSMNKRACSLRMPQQPWGKMIAAIGAFCNIDIVASFQGKNIEMAPRNWTIGWL